MMYYLARNSQILRTHLTRLDSRDCQVTPFYKLFNDILTEKECTISFKPLRFAQENLTPGQAGIDDAPCVRNQDIQECKGIAHFLLTAEGHFSEWAEFLKIYRTHLYLDELYKIFCKTGG